MQHEVKLLGLIWTAMMTAQIANAGTVLLHEDFEDGALDSRMSYLTRNITSSQAGIKDYTGFGSTKAFDFGRSNAGANAFQNHITWLKVDFGTPTYIDSIAWQMREAGNWGSSGHIYLDEGYPDRPTEARLADSYLGRQPSNDRKSDPAPVAKDVPVMQNVTFLYFRVSDITRSSNLWIDNITITGSDATVPTPTAAVSGLLGMLCVDATRRRRWFA